MPHFPGISGYRPSQDLSWPFFFSKAGSGQQDSGVIPHYRQQKGLDKEVFYNRMRHLEENQMLLTQLIPAEQLARLSATQVDVLVAALDTEILQNTAIRKSLSSKLQQVHKNVVAAAKKSGGSEA